LSGSKSYCSLSCIESINSLDGALLPERGRVISRAAACRPVIRGMAVSSPRRRHRVTAIGE
jgi:hypothetical protein